MEKICPNCARRCADTAGFCPICGTSLQNVMPVNVDYKSSAQSVNTSKRSLAATILSFIPLVLSILNVFAIACLDWLSVMSREVGLYRTFSFSDILKGMAQGDETAVVFLLGGILPLMIDLILVFVGSVLLACRKSAGRTLTIVGNAIILQTAAVGIVGIIIISIAIPVEYGSINLGAGPIVLLISTIAGIVFTSLSKVGKALHNADYASQPPAYAGQTVFPANMSQQNYPPQYQNQNYYSNGQY